MNFLKSIIIFLVLIITLFIWQATYSASVCGNSLFSINCNANIPYCDPNWNEPCWLAEWVNQVKWQIGNMESNRSFSVYAQDIIKYVLWFITLIAVIYIIYAWFNILVWAWDEEKAKKTKSIIIYVIIWMFIIWLAYPIVLFIINILNTWNAPI